MLCYSGDDLVQIQNAMNADLQLVYSWTVANKLTINQNKTKCTFFSTKRKKKQLDYPAIYLGSTKIDFVEKYEYLGFMLDSCLTFEPHLLHTLQRINLKAHNSLQGPKFDKSASRITNV